MTITSTLKAVAVAQLAAQSGKALVPQVNTPLELLTRSNFTQQWSFDYTAGAPTEEQTQAIAAAIGITGISDPLAEQEYMKFAEQISQAVSAHMDMARSVVLPELKIYVQAVSDRMAMPKTIASDFKLTIVDLPIPMQNEGFKRRIESFKDGIYANPPVRLQLPVPSEPVDALLTGSNDFDDSIRQWVNSLDADAITTMWKDVFTTEGRARNLIDFFEEGEKGVQYALFVWFSLNHLLEDIPEGVQYTLQDLQRFTAPYLEVAANRIQKEYTSAQMHETAQMLILGQNKYSNSLTVNGPVYREFVKNGGKNEALLGGLLSGHLGKTLGEVQAKADEYYAEYERSEALAASLRRNQAFNEFKSALLWCISTIKQEELTEVERTAWLEMNITVPGILKRAQQLIDDLQVSDMENMHATCLKVLCRSRFYYTDAESFLTSMDNAMKANPAMNVREAGLVALIEKIGDYIADQIVVRNV